MLQFLSVSNVTRYQHHSRPVVFSLFLSSSSLCWAEEGDQNKAERELNCFAKSQAAACVADRRDLNSRGLAPANYEHKCCWKISNLSWTFYDSTRQWLKRLREVYFYEKKTKEHDFFRQQQWKLYIYMRKNLSRQKMKILKILYDEIDKTTQEKSAREIITFLPRFTSRQSAECQ